MSQVIEQAGSPPSGVAPKAILTERVTDCSAWLAADFAAHSPYVRTFEESEIDEIDAALASLRRSPLPYPDIRALDLPLPRFSRVLAEIQDELENGRGFVLLRGFPVERYELEDLKLVHVGLLAHMGTLISQDPQATFVESVMDRGMSYTPIQVRGYMTRAELTPHCDSGDVVALLCVRKAREGGISQIASGTSIHNEILEAHPEYLEPLYRGFHHNIRGNGPAGRWENITRHRVPVFSYYRGRLSIRFNLKSMLTAQELPGVEPLSYLERAAIECVGDLAMGDDLRLDIDLEPGDIQLLNNHMILHTRTAFDDYAEPAAKRLLIRSWINMPNSRPLEDDFADHFNTGPRRPPALKPA